MESNTKLVFDLADNPELAAYVGGLQPGDPYCLTICGTVAVNDERRFEGEIEDIEYESEDEETGETEQKSAKVTSDEPAAAKIITDTKK